MSGLVLSLCDRTGNMVGPWAEAGYECWCVDLAEVPSRSENLKHFQVDVREFVSAWNWHDREIAAVFAFPPCTHLAVSGARWFRAKGLRSVIEALEIVEACREVCEASRAPWMLENPVSTLSTYWREPDYSFDPWEFSDYEGGEGDLYTKKTCLWTGGGFEMPERRISANAPLFSQVLAIDDRIHQMPPSDERAELRSVTPKGFARAVFEANCRSERIKAQIEQENP